VAVVDDIRDTDTADADELRALVTAQAERIRELEAALARYRAVLRYPGRDGKR
jgi:hypothetical protein